MMNLIDQQDPKINAIIDAAAEIHGQLGHGFHKAIYQEAAVIEFALREIPFQSDALLPVTYKDHFLPTHYKADFICFSDIFVEFKAISNLSDFEEAQVMNCLKATGLRRGALINFGAPGLQYKCLVREKNIILNSINRLVQSV